MVEDKKIYVIPTRTVPQGITALINFTFDMSADENEEVMNKAIRDVKTGQVIVSQLAKVGIKAEIQLVDWSTWLSDVYVGRDHDATIIGLDAQMAPSDVMRFYPTESGKNFMNYSNAQFDEVFAKAKAAVDENEKAELYKQCEKILTEDAAAAYIQSPAQLVAVNPKLGGYTFYPIYVQDMSSVYFKK